MAVAAPTALAYHNDDQQDVYDALSVEQLLVLKDIVVYDV